MVRSIDAGQFYNPSVGYEQISVSTVFARRGLQSAGIDEIPLAQGNKLFRSN